MDLKLIESLVHDIRVILWIETSDPYMHMHTYSETGPEFQEPTMAKVDPEAKNPKKQGRR